MARLARQPGHYDCVLRCSHDAVDVLAALIVTRRDNMFGAELLRLNLTETRRRSIRIWRAIPLSLSEWRPDPHAMSCFEMVRHVLETDYLHGQMIRERRSYSGDSPFADRHFDNLDAALVSANLATSVRCELLRDMRFAR